MELESYFGANLIKIVEISQMYPLEATFLTSLINNLLANNGDLCMKELPVSWNMKMFLQ